MNAYYNEYDPKAAAWLRELIKAGQIAPGFVDERSITEVDPEYVKLFTQAHFFAGIGGWSYALRLAGWPDDRPVWTGSPPCQPFSNAGKQKGKADARHLWPVFFNLIRECRPANIFGEQVEAAIRTGWLDDLQDDLEAEGYATGKIVLPACSVGSFHIRQRIWFVAERLADSIDERSQGRLSRGADAEWKNINGHPGCGRSDCGLADSTDNGHIAADGLRETPESSEQTRAQNVGQSSGSLDGRLADTRLQRQEERQEQTAGGKQCSEISGLGNTEHAGLHGVEMPGSPIKTSNGSEEGQSIPSEPTGTGSAVVSGALRFWGNPDWLYCRDGKWRPVESGTFPLANGVSERVGLLRGYGNAIVSQVAAEVIKAYVATTND